MGKSERVEGQESLHTAGGPAGYLCSATIQSRHCKCTCGHDVKILKLKPGGTVHTVTTRLQVREGAS